MKGNKYIRKEKKLARNGVWGKRIIRDKIPYPPSHIIGDKVYFNRICKVFKKDVVQVRRHIKELVPLLTEEEKKKLLG